MDAGVSKVCEIFLLPSAGLLLPWDTAHSSFWDSTLISSVETGDQIEEVSSTAPAFGAIRGMEAAPSILDEGHAR